MPQYSLCSLDPPWRGGEREVTLDCLAAGVVGTSGVFYSVWLYNLFQGGRVSHLSHLALTVVANGTRIFRLLALSGSLMAWRATHQAVGLVAREVMQRFGEQLREAPPPRPNGGDG